MNLLKSLAAVSSMTMFSRVLGFARDAIVARIFGAGMATDAFLWHSNFLTCYAEFLPKAHFRRRLCRFLLSTKASRGRCYPRVCCLRFRTVDAGAGCGDGSRDVGCAMGDFSYRAGVCRHSG